MCRWGKVKVDRLHVFPVSLVASTLGLYNVAVQFSSPVNDSPGNLFSICWGPEQYLLAWTELRKGMSSVGLVKLGTLILFAREEVVSDSLHVAWLGGLTRALSYCVGFPWQRHVGPNGANLRFSRTLSMGFFDERVVLSAVLIVLLAIW